jgi:hypothetical protein
MAWRSLSKIPETNGCRQIMSRKKVIEDKKNIYTGRPVSIRDQLHHNPILVHHRHDKNDIFYKGNCPSLICHAIS